VLGAESPIEGPVVRHERMLKPTEQGPVMRLDAAPHRTVSGWTVAVHEALPSDLVRAFDPALPHVVIEGPPAPTGWRSLEMSLKAHRKQLRIDTMPRARTLGKLLAVGSLVAAEAALGVLLVINGRRSDPPPPPLPPNPWQINGAVGHLEAEAVAVERQCLLEVTDDEQRRDRAQGGADRNPCVHDNSPFTTRHSSVEQGTSIENPQTADDRYSA
jgi:hypothetical protein